jgi:hypothetical protein
MMFTSVLTTKVTSLIKMARTTQDWNDIIGQGKWLNIAQP